MLWVLYLEHDELFNTAWWMYPECSIGECWSSLQFCWDLDSIIYSFVKFCFAKHLKRNNLPHFSFAKLQTFVLYGVIHHMAPNYWHPWTCIPPHTCSSYLHHTYLPTPKFSRFPQKCWDMWYIILYLKLNPTNFVVTPNIAIQE